MISRIKARLSGIRITRLDKRRAWLAMAWAQRHPATATVYNLGNYLFLFLIKMGLFAARAFSGPKAEQPPEVPHTDGSEFPLPARRDHPRVLMVVEDTIPQCFEYRVQQKLDMFALLGWQARWLRWPDLEQAYREVHYHDVVLLYRVPGFDKVLPFIRYAASLNKLLIYDLDDLIFDRRELERKFSKDRKQLSRRTYEDVLNGADLYKKAIAEVPYCFVSTQPLKKEVEKIAQVEGFVLPNGISGKLSSLVESPPAEESHRATVHIIYGSGTRTHDADFLFISPALLDILASHPQTRLIIVGPVNIDQDFERFGERVTRIGFLDYPAYLELLACADINVAPLEPGIFADCKSAIKWLEAGMLGVPSIVSRTSTYEAAIEQGVTGFMADQPEEWRSILSKLVDSAELRRSIGAGARSRIEKESGLGSLSRELRSLIDQCWQLHAAKSTAPPTVSARPRILVVNTLYPPQAMGGATRIARDLIAGLRRDYVGEYEIEVFTCEVSNGQPYRLRQYMQDGVVVTLLSVPLRPDVDIQQVDDEVHEIFRRFLSYARPDIVHFHSIQHLTASTVAAAEELGIPFVVTLHDSWWISDHPFMLDDENRLLPPHVSHPLVAKDYSSDLNATLSRNRYLRDRLRAAAALVAVSDYQTDLYRQNGFVVRTIENGVDPPDGYARHEEDVLVLGYIGGKSVHKGYYFLKDIVSNTPLSNVRMVTIDLFNKDQRIRKENWGDTPVEIHPKYDFSEAGKFYSMIDVLIMPSMWPESFGLASREASLLGIWVVAAATGGLTESVIEGETGNLFSAGDGAQLRSILLDLSHNRSRFQRAVDRQSTGKLAIRSVAQNASDYHALYQDILSAKQDLETAQA